MKSLTSQKILLGPTTTAATPRPRPTHPKPRRGAGYDQPCFPDARALEDPRSSLLADRGPGRRHGYAANVASAIRLWPHGAGQTRHFASGMWTV